MTRIRQRNDGKGFVHASVTVGKKLFPIFSGTEDVANFYVRTQTTEPIQIHEMTVPNLLLHLAESVHRCWQCEA